MALLRIIDGPGTGQVFTLGAEGATLGRDVTNPVRIDDPKSSRVHAEVALVGGRWQVKDLGSSNGTWTEAGRITSLPLVHGAVFRIGKAYLRFESREEDTLAGEGESTWADPARIEGLAGGRRAGRPRCSCAPRARARPEARAPAERNLLERTNAYLVLLHQLVVRAAEAQGRDQLFELLDDAAAEALEGDRCAVFLPSAAPADRGWALWPAHERRLRARFGAVPFARTLLDAVRSRKEPLLCTRDGDIDPSASMAQAGVRSAMAAPLRLGDEVHALLYVDRIAAIEPFSRTELEFLAAVANQLAVQLHNRANVAHLEAEVERLIDAPKAAPLALVGTAPALVAVRGVLARAAVAPAPVLLLGESGTGKELAARILHQGSPRAARPFQIAACAATGGVELETMLFGRAAGGAGDAARPGIFELADQATLFLDEVGELPPALQGRLLRLLDQGEVQRSGDGAVRRVDVRLIAASARDLGDEVAAGRFRADLLTRLEVVTVTMPPLRERLGDLDLLIDHFLAENARRLAQPLRKLAPEARAVLLRHPWPGNVRQLKNVIERACVLATDQVIQAADLPDTVRGADLPSGASPIASLAAVERAHILRVLDQCGGNKKAAAEMLEIDRSTLYAKLRQYGQA